MKAMRGRLCPGFAALLFCPLILANAAAATAPTGETNTPVGDLDLMSGPGHSFGEMANSALHSPDTYNALVGALRNQIVGDNTNAYLQLIKDFNINFKVFDADSAGGEAGLGFDYSFDRSVVGRTINPDKDNPLGLSFAVHAKGNVAFDQKKNPDDFLDSGASIHLFQSVGGWEPTVRQQLISKTRPDGTTFETTEAQELINGLDLSLTEDQRSKDEQWRKFFDFIDQRSRLQIFWDVAGNFSLESNQDFSRKQMAYGLKLGGLVRAWNPNSPWARWNVLDYPFAAIRYLTRTDENWSPSGQALPSCVVGVDLVDPLNDSVRFAVDPDKSAYPRFRAEVAFKTQVLRWKEDHIWLALSYRHFQEIGASAAISNAHLDQTDYFAATLDLIYGFNVSYSTGRLPLDLESDRVFALGWKLNF